MSNEKKNYTAYQRNGRVVLFVGNTEHYITDEIARNLAAGLVSSLPAPAAPESRGGEEDETFVDADLKKCSIPTSEEIAEMQKVQDGLCKMAGGENTPELAFTSGANWMRDRMLRYFAAERQRGEGMALFTENETVSPTLNSGKVKSLVSNFVKEWDMDYEEVARFAAEILRAECGKRGGWAPSDDEVAKWYDEWGIKDASPSTAVYKFRSYFMPLMSALLDKAREERWIPIETLPEKSGMVLIFTKAGDVFTAHYKKNLNLFTAYGVNSIEITDIETTHWQPIPEPPAAFLAGKEGKNPDKP